MNDDRDIFIGAYDDCETWIKAQLHCSLRSQIQDSPLWQKEGIPDIPLDERQMMMFAKGYAPDSECRYAPFLLGGWFYITRSGYWLKKFKYKQQKDGLYHITEHYTTEKEKGRNLLKEVLREGYFHQSFYDDRLKELLYDRFDEGGGRRFLVDSYNSMNTDIKENRALFWKGFGQHLREVPEFLQLYGAESLLNRLSVYNDRNANDLSLDRSDCHIYIAINKKQARIGLWFVGQDRYMNFLKKEGKINSQLSESYIWERTTKNAHISCSTSLDIFEPGCYDKVYRWLSFQIIDIIHVVSQYPCEWPGL